MAESQLEQRYIGLLMVDLGRAMKRSKNARWLGIYWAKFDGKAHPEYSLAKAIALRDLFVQFVSSKKPAIDYLVKNDISDDVLRNDALVYVISQIWEWKLAAGAIEDEGIANQVAMVFLCRQFQAATHRALGHEFKAVHKAIAGLQNSTADIEIAAYKKACTEQLSLLSEQLKTGLTKALKDGCPDQYKNLLLPSLEDAA